MAGTKQDGEEVGQQPCRLSLAQPVRASQHGAGGLKAGTVLPGQGLPASGHAAAGAAKAMTTILRDDRKQLRNIQNLVAKRIRVIAVRGFVTIATGGGFTFKHTIGRIPEAALGLGMSVLATGFVGRGRLGRRA